MIGQIITAGSRDSIELMIRQSTAEIAARGLASAVETIVGIGHLVACESRTKTPLVETAEMGHQRETLDSLNDIGPHLRKIVGIIRIGARQPVHGHIARRIIIRRGMDKAVILIGYFSVSDHHYTNAAYARWISVGRFEIYSCKIFHSSLA